MEIELGMTDARPMRILLVEDDAMDAQALRRAFTRCDIACEITQARDGREALELLHDGRAPDPCLILLDLHMPRMGGIAFLEALRSDARLKRRIVIVLTSSSADEDRNAAYGYNVAGYLLKDRLAGASDAVPRLLKRYWNLVEWPAEVPAVARC